MSIKYKLVLTVISLLVLVAGLLMIRGIFTKAHYLDPWSKTYVDQFSDPRLKLVANGSLAPNGHNMQPWKIKLDPNDSNVLYLYVDNSLLTPEVDPLARQTMVTQGTYLEYMKVAGMKLGYSTEIQLFPNGSYDKKNLKHSMQTIPVAKITIAKMASSNNQLYDALFLSDTDRGAYKPDPLTTSQVAQLEVTNNDPNFSIKMYQDPTNRSKLGAFATAGTKIESGVDRISAETATVFRFNERQKNQYRSGFSVEGQASSGIKVYHLQGAITLFPSLVDNKAAAATAIVSTQTAVDHTPAYAMIISKDNSRTNQIKSGMFYANLVLTGHSLGLVMQPPSQVLEEYSEMSGEYAAIHKEYAAEGGTIQMFLRLGQPTIQYLLSMRRNTTSFILPNN